MRYSIIVVCLNAGEKLNRTLDSILSQTCDDYEIIVKDGGSRDGSIERMRQDKRIRLYTEPDSGIYSAMNQAAAHACGKYLLFLNCGDVFYQKDTLKRAAEYMDSCGCAEGQRMVFYGDTYSEKSGVIIASPPKIDGFACYRNIPCHQSCFYGRALCQEKPYDLKYAIRADYDHFLWCRYAAGAEMLHMGIIVSSYEGGGFSENRENRYLDKQEHRQITAAYMTKGELFRYRLLLCLTLAPLRRKMAESRLFAEVYHKMKGLVYKGRQSLK